jgi:hypothetical protein
MDFSKLTDEELQLAEKLATWTKGKFSEDQFNNAKKVQEKTIAKGLNPDFILPMVMAESGFNQNAKSPKGANGVMQITDDTADFYKCKNVKDLDQNIDCGLNMISDLVSKKTIGNDPYKVLSGYNAGPNTKYFTSGKIEDLPDETISHMDKVSDFYGGSLPHVSGEKPKDSEGPAAGESSGDATIKDPNDIIKPAPKGLPGETDPYAVIGGVVGTSLASGTETGKRLLPLIPNLINKVGGQAIDVNKPASRMALQNWLNSMLQSNSQNVKLPVSELEKLTGKKIRTMGELGEAYKDIQELKEQKVTKPMVKLVEGRPGVFEQTGRMTTSTVPGRAPIDLTPYEVKGGPLRQAIGRQMQTAGEVTKSIVPSIGRIGLGGLGGANAAVNAYDAWEMAQKLKAQKDPSWLDYARLATKTMATAGGALSMVPLGYSQVIGAGLQAPEAAISLGEQAYGGLKALNERRKTATKEDTDRMLMNVDPMGNPMP